MKAIFKSYIETDSKVIATDCANALKKILDPIGTPKVVKVEKYWKIKEYYEIQLSLEQCLITSVDEILKSSLNKISEDWKVNSSEEEISFLWDFNQKRNIFDSKIRWLNLELFAV